MKEEILKEIKKEYEEIIETKEKLKSLNNRLKELEENQYVKEYLDAYHKLHELNSKNEMYLPEDILFRRSVESNIRYLEETNGIYVYIGTYRNSIESDIMCLRDEKVKYNDPRAEFRIYIDIEKINDEKIVPINECKEFEKNNTVIFLKTAFPQSKIYKVQEEFLKEAIKTNQEEAKKRILKKYKNL